MARSHRMTLRIEQLEDRRLLAGDLDSPESIPALLDIENLEYRTIDGTENNVDNLQWGSTDEQLIRVSSADYEDGISDPAGVDRANPREISNALAAQEEARANDRQLSTLLYVWGQFLDHDIDLTLTSDLEAESLDIAVPVGDPLFDPDGSGTAVIPFDRSEYDTTTGADTENPREQVNSITAWIDGSMIYGSDQQTADSLRTFVGGRLRTSDGDLLPTDEDGTFLAGDIRVNENVALTAMHTLFLREHNGWADRIAAANPQLSDEEIYQQARAIVIAEIQAITYNEFLPALLGEGAISTYDGYDPTVNPSISNEFSTAAFRLGHSLINDSIPLFDDDGRATGEEISLSEAFFNPDLLRETGIDAILMSSASTQSQELDNEIVDSLRNFLFGAPGQGGLDLASLNIQRGRDHGLADYNTVREAYGLERVQTFAEISSDPEVQLALRDVYGDVNDIDLWVGALAEDHVSGGSIGELVQTILVDQFERLRDGDRLWYQNAFSGEQLREIERTTLADMIARNSNVTSLQENVFFMRAVAKGTVFFDANSDGEASRRERGIADVTVELLDNEGVVVARTATDSRGVYRFTEFTQTGDYQIRIILPNGTSAAGATTLDVLVPRGDTEIANLDFGLLVEPDEHDHRERRHERHYARHVRHVDAVFDRGEDFDDLFNMFGPRRRT